MNAFKDSLAFWANIVGTLVAIFGVLQSRSWVVAAGVFIVLGSISALGYASRQRTLIESAALKVAGRSIDSLNLATLQRHVSRSLVIQQAENTAVIDGENLAVTWDCTGYCQAERETAIEFSIDADANVPFAELNCVAYDLKNDPGKRHGIRPILIGTDGISKKVAIPFLAPLAAHEPFHIFLDCKLPGCMKAGVDYYTASLSFEQERVQRCRVRLAFLHDLPQWLRVYEIRAGSEVSLLKDLRPTRKTAAMCEYEDIADNIPARSARVYVFSRSAPLGGHSAYQIQNETSTMDFRRQG
jgi:hypothetical protein